MLLAENLVGHRRSFVPGLALVALLMVGGCKDAASQPGHTTPRGAVIAVGSYTSPPPGAVNNFWVETEHGVVVIDAQRVVSEGVKSLEAIKALQKPILGIFITHAHPDHYGGLSALTDAAPDAPVYASELTKTIIATDALGFGRATAQALPDDFPAKPVAPTTLVHDAEVREIDGVTFEVVELGAGEANSMTALRLPEQGVAFVGDAVSDGFTPALLQGMSLSWLGQLDVLETRLGSLTTWYLGHGDSGAPAELVRGQREYLTFFRGLVAEQMTTTGTVDGAGQTAIEMALNQRYPGYAPVASLPNLVEVNVAAVAHEMAGLAALPAP